MAPAKRKREQSPARSGKKVFPLLLNPSFFRKPISFCFLDKYIFHNKGLRRCKPDLNLSRESKQERPASEFGLAELEIRDLKPEVRAKLRVFVGKSRKEKLQNTELVWGTVFRHNVRRGPADGYRLLIKSNCSVRNGFVDKKKSAKVPTGDRAVQGREEGATYGSTGSQAAEGEEAPAALLGFASESWGKRVFGKCKTWAFCYLFRVGAAVDARAWAGAQGVGTPSPCPRGSSRRALWCAETLRGFLSGFPFRSFCFFEDVFQLFEKLETLITGSGRDAERQGAGLHTPRTLCFSKLQKLADCTLSNLWTRLGCAFSLWLMFPSLKTKS